MMPDPLSNLDASKAGVSKVDPITIPGYVPDTPKSFDPQKHRVRYLKVDMDDPAAITELEILETRALRNDGVYVLDKSKMLFMDKVFLVVQYIERI